MLLGDVVLRRATFSDLESSFREFSTREFQGLIDRKRSEWVNRVLLELIQKEPEPCFLLAAVLEFIERVEKEGLLQHYTFTSFELWLNQFSHLSAEENARVRAKIAGKAIDRSDYQGLFPISMGKVFEGTHFVTAHRSPDLDTTISSFWGWVDAFAARVGDGLHIWNLPGGPPGSQIEMDLIFREIFGPAIFTHLPKTRTALILTGNDLMQQRQVHRKVPQDPLSSIDHSRDIAVLVVNEEGFFQGDWRAVDVEGVHRVMMLLSICLRWFENNLHLQLISLFAEGHPVKERIIPALRRIFDLKIGECEPVRTFTPSQLREMREFLVQVLEIKQGLESSFGELSEGLFQRGMVRFPDGDALVSAMEKEHLFDEKGHLIEDRPRILHYLEKIIRELHEAIFTIRAQMEQFDIALAIKEKVFQLQPLSVSVRSDVEEIRAKMGSNQFLAVVYPDQERLFPMGVILASDLQKSRLGTVSLRDFCNRDEMTIPSYLDVISVIDHHKSSLNTFSPPLAIIGDAQSTNTLLAERVFQINDRYSLGGMPEEEIEERLASKESAKTMEAMRIMQRLYQRRLALEYTGWFIHPDREFIEYLHFLYGILDDTDLLSKVTSLDIEIVASLLNRLKSLSEKKEVEVIQFDDLPRDKHFCQRAAQRLLQNDELFSLYRKVYQYREKEIERNIQLCAEQEPSHFFADTKEQNGCSRIGQTKIFDKNVSLFEKRADAIRRHWLKIAKQTHENHPEIDLHIHMMSTIVSAEEVYKGTQGKYNHQDEMWIWASEDEMGIEHLKNFLNAFQRSPGWKNNHLDVEFLGGHAEELGQIFRESFLESSYKIAKKPDPALPIAILRYNAGSFNSRKALVSPYLPTLAK